MLELLSVYDSLLLGLQKDVYHYITIIIKNKEKCLISLRFVCSGFNEHEAVVNSC